MTYKEIRNEAKKDFQDVVNFAVKKASSYEREIKKSKIFPLRFKPIKYISKRFNEYYILFQANSKKDWKNNNIFLTILCIYESEKGLNAIMFYEERSKCAIYSTHFFSRYRSRYLKDKALSTEDVILHYFKYNTANYGKIVDDCQHFTATCEHGVCFGQVIDNENIRRFKTFVGFDMLFDSQDEYRNEFFQLLHIERNKIQNVLVN